MCIPLNSASLIDRLTEDVDFGKKIIFSDEAHFDLGGYVNNQNCRIWGTENPHAYIEKPTHPKRVAVWCGFWSKGIIGPLFFENKQGEAITVNENRYRTMLNEFLFIKIEDKDIANIWFQQDVGTCHAAEAILYVLRPVFEDSIIGSRPDIVWPPRSCDLTPLDCYLWDAVEDKCYADKPELQLHTIHNVLKNWTDREGYCMASRARHLNEIIFHY